MAEWFKAHAWKACKEAILTWVRIPFSPPNLVNKIDQCSYYLICYKFLYEI